VTNETEMEQQCAEIKVSECEIEGWI